MKIKFLNVDMVKEFQEESIKDYGGSTGIRDKNLLESAVFAPQAGSGEEYFYKDIFEMSTAYLFGIMQNHPFIDGNKRAAVISAIVFLEINGMDFIAKPKELYKTALKVANSEIKDKSIIENFLRENSRKSPFIY